MSIQALDHFREHQLAAAARQIPVQWGLLQRLGIFSATPVRSPLIKVEEENGVMSLLAQTPRGSHATPFSAARRKMRTFSIPRYAAELMIIADELDGVRAYGENTVMRQVTDYLRDRMAELRASIDITREFQQAGAIAGVIKDADGITVADLFSEFGVSQQEVDFVLGTDTTDVTGKLRTVADHIEKNLKGDVMTGITAIASATWFDKFIAHPEIQEAYKYYQAVRSPLRDDVRESFQHAGVTFYRYIGEANFLDEGGTTTQKMVADGDVRFIPTGTLNTFREFHGPADWLEALGTPGEPVYFENWPDPQTGGQRYRTLHAQMNNLAFCMRPSVLVRGYSSN